MATFKTNLEELRQFVGVFDTEALDLEPAEAAALIYRIGLIKAGVHPADIGPQMPRKVLLPARNSPPAPLVASAEVLRALIRSHEPAAISRVTGDALAYAPAAPRQPAIPAEAKLAAPDPLLGYRSADRTGVADLANW